MAIEWEETVETKRMVRLTVTHGPSCHDATVDDLRSACEAAGLVVETMERAEADREDRTALRESLQKMHDERIVCLDALSESVTPGGTTLSPRPPSVLAGIRSLQGRLRDARSDLREHDAALEAAVERRSEEADASTEQARAILNAVPGEDIVSAARRTMASLGLTAARARAEKAESRISKAEATSGVSLESVASAFACKKLGINPDSDLRAALTEARTVLSLCKTARIRGTPEYRMVSAIGDELGYGAIMSAASSAWAEMFDGTPQEGSQHTCGPSEFTVRRAIARIDEVLSPGAHVGAAKKGGGG